MNTFLPNLMAWSHICEMSVKSKQETQKPFIKNMIVIGSLAIKDEVQ